MPATILPVRVEIKPDTDLPIANLFTVSPIWTGVDRPYTGGIGVKGMAMAKRLERAFLSGAAFSSTKIEKDINGKTYVSATYVVMGRHLNADLKKIGY